MLGDDDMEVGQPKQGQASDVAGGRRLLVNASWLGAANIAVKPLWFVFITVACARVLGADGYGALTTALSLGAVAFALTNFGAAQYIVREVARDSAQAPRLFTHFLSLRLLLIAMAAAGVGVAAWALDYERPLVLTTGAVCVYHAGLTLTEYARAYFQAFEVLQYEAISVLVEKLLVIAGGASMLVAVATPAMTVAGMAIGTVFTATGVLLFVARKLVPERNGLDWPYAKSVLPALVPYGLVSLLGMMFFRIDTVMVEALLSTVAAAQYGLPFRFVEALNMIPAVVVTAAGYPRLAKLCSEERFGAATRLLWRIAAGLLVVGVIGAGVLSVISDPLMTWVTDDPELQASAPVLRVLCWAFPLTSLRTLLAAVLLSLDMPRAVAGGLFGGVVLNVGLNLWLIPQLGVTGAALTTLACELLLLAAYAFLCHLRLRHR
ncbi:MAG: flippase [Bacteroidota bacterium]